MADHLTHNEALKEYKKIFGILMFLTAVTIGAAFMHDILTGALGIFIGLLIASIKTIAVIWIFMHIKFDNPYLRIFIVVPLFFFGVMILTLRVIGI